jgi:hypothetical protein
MGTVANGGSELGYDGQGPFPEQAVVRDVIAGGATQLGDFFIRVSDDAGGAVTGGGHPHGPGGAAERRCGSSAAAMGADEPRGAPLGASGRGGTIGSIWSSLACRIGHSVLVWQHMGSSKLPRPQIGSILAAK